MKIRVIGNNTIDMGGGKILSPDIVYDEKTLSAKEMTELVSQKLAEDADKIVKENKTAATEIETLKAIAALYPAQFKAGKIIFKSLNLDNATSKPFADKCKAEGQSLLIISGNKRIDLTDQAFMYANSKPEKLKAEIKNVIDKMM